MDNKAIINQTIKFVKESLINAEGGHDWWHIYRVWKTAKHIAQHEDVDLFIVELGSLLHDIADSKFHNGNEEIGPKKTVQFLTSLNVDKAIITHIENIVKHISFKGGNLAQGFTSPELSVVQDADRIDAIGAIGIARAFNYGGFKNRELYNPDVLPNLKMTKEEYKTSSAPTLNHFYEKLLLLKDRMNTATGREIALQRHKVMEDYLSNFYSEWEGES